MADPMPPVDLDDALAAEQEVIRALKRAPPGETIEQARMRCCKLIEAQSRRIAASRRTVAMQSRRSERTAATATRPRSKTYSPRRF
jgi:hypothetical protein